MPSFVQKISDAVSQGLSGKTIGSSTIVGTGKDLENQFKYKDFEVSNPPWAARSDNQLQVAFRYGSGL